MKIIINVDKSLKKEEIIINCKKLDDNIKELYDNIQSMLSTKFRLVFYDGAKEIYLETDEILFFQTEEGFVYGHTENKVYKVKERLYELEEILSKNFIRISKSTIINVNKVLSVTKNITSSSLITFNSSYKKVYASRHYFNNLQKALSERRY